MRRQQAPTYFDSYHSHDVAGLHDSGPIGRPINIHSPHYYIMKSPCYRHSCLFKAKVIITGLVSVGELESVLSSVRGGLDIFKTDCDAISKCGNFHGVLCVFNNSLLVVIGTRRPIGRWAVDGRQVTGSRSVHTGLAGFKKKCINRCPGIYAFWYEFWASSRTQERRNKYMHL